MSGGTTAVATATAAGASASALASAAAADATFDAVTAGGGFLASLAPSAGVSTALSLAGTGISAYGQYQQGQAAKAAGKYNAAVQQENVQIADQNAQWASEEGEANAAASEQKTRAQVGSIAAAQGASGIDVNSGSNLDVKSSASELGELNALNIRANAAREAYGYQTQAANAQAQSNLDLANAKNSATAGDIGAGASLLSGIGSAGMGYQKYLMNQNPMNNTNNSDLYSSSN